MITIHPGSHSRQNILLRKINPAISDKRGTMVPEELESYLKKLAAFYMYKHATELTEDEVIQIQLVEFSIESLYHIEKFSKGVYSWLENHDHWIWPVAKEVADDIFCEKAIHRISDLVGNGLPKNSDNEGSDNEEPEGPDK